MKRYCLDTSGLSNPLENMPEDIHVTLWQRVATLMESGQIAVTTEIYDELTHLEGNIGTCLKKNKSELLLEIGEDWDWQTYLSHFDRMREQYREFISEYNGNRKGTVGLNDISIIALAKTLNLPVVSMEANLLQGEKKKRIPNICDYEGVLHLTFSDLLRRESIAV